MNTVLLDADLVAEKQELRIRPVENARDFKQFQELQKHLYCDDPLWVPPLYSEEKTFFSDKNPYIRDNPYQLFLLQRQGKVIGRIAATVSKAHNSYWDEKTGFFGFFECENNPYTAAMLLDASAGYLKGKGMDRMRGPFNLTTNHTSGLLADGYDTSPVIEMTYNHDYYVDLLEQNGLREIKQLLAYWVDLSHGVPGDATLRQISSRFREKDLCIRNITAKGTGFYRDMDMFYEIYQSAWQHNWGFVPVEKDEYDFMVERMRPLIQPELTLVAEIQGEPAGFYLTIPDFNQVIKLIKGRLTPLNLVRILFAQRKINAGRLIVAGIKDKFRHTALASLMFYKSLQAAYAKGYKGVELSWILEDNMAVHNYLKHFNIPVYKRYGIFEKNI